MADQTTHIHELPTERLEAFRAALFRVAVEEFTLAGFQRLAAEFDCPPECIDLPDEFADSKMLTWESNQVARTLERMLLAGTRHQAFDAVLARDALGSYDGDPDAPGVFRRLPEHAETADEKTAVVLMQRLFHGQRGYKYSRLPPAYYPLCMDRGCNDSQFLLPATAVPQLKTVGTPLKRLLDTSRFQWAIVGRELARFLEFVDRLSEPFSHVYSRAPST